MKLKLKLNCRWFPIFYIILAVLVIILSYFFRNFIGVIIDKLIIPLTAAGLLNLMIFKGGDNEHREENGKNIEKTIPDKSIDDSKQQIGGLQRKLSFLMNHKLGIYKIFYSYIIIFIIAGYIQFVYIGIGDNQKPIVEHQEPIEQEQLLVIDYVKPLSSVNNYCVAHCYETVDSNYNKYIFSSIEHCSKHALKDVMKITRFPNRFDLYDDISSSSSKNLLLISSKDVNTNFNINLHFTTLLDSTLSDTSINKAIMIFDGSNKFFNFKENEFESNTAFNNIKHIYEQLDFKLISIQIDSTYVNTPSFLYTQGGLFSYVFMHLYPHKYKAPDPIAYFEIVLSMCRDIQSKNLLAQPFCFDSYDVEDVCFKPSDTEILGENCYIYMNGKEEKIRNLILARTNYLDSLETVFKNIGSKNFVKKFNRESKRTPQILMDISNSDAEIFLCEKFTNQIGTNNFSESIKIDNESFIDSVKHCQVNLMYKINRIYSRYDCKSKNVNKIYLYKDLINENS